MTIYRYSFQGNFTNRVLENNVAPGVTVSFNSIGPSLFVDINLQTGEPVADLTACLNELGWVLVATDPQTPKGVVNQGIIVRGVTAASAVGSTDTAVLLFDGATTQVGAVTLADWVTRVDSATLGTTLVISQPGEYVGVVYVPLAAGFNIQTGVTLNAPAGIRQGNFEIFDPSVFSSTFKFSSTIQSSTSGLTLPMIITQADIDAGNNIIRGQITDVAGAAPVAGAYANAANVALRLARMGNVAA